MLRSGIASARMRFAATGMAAVAICFAVAGCQNFMTPTSTPPPPPNTGPAYSQVPPPYQAPPPGGYAATATAPGGVAPAGYAQPQYVIHKPKLAVREFTNKTGVHWWNTNKSVGEGMEEQLVTALFQTGAFIILERNSIDAVLDEQDFAQSGRVREGSGPATGEVEGADFFIYGAVTEFMEGQAGAGGTIGGFSNPGGRLLAGAVGAALNQDHVAIDLRVVNARTGEIVNATTIEGKARDLSGAIGGTYGQVLGGLSGSYNTPMQKAVRSCMIQAANFIAANTLQGQLPPSAQAPAPAPPPPTAVVPPPAPAPAPAAVAPPPAPAPAAAAGPSMTIRAASASLYFKPGGSLVTGELRAGETVQILDEDGEWVNVQAADGRTGWIPVSAFNP